ncbi:MAG: hypothetical protein AAF581_00540 [Planctomycetota bacterium]
MRHAGWTLVEVVVATALAMILLALVVASWVALTARQQRNAEGLARFDRVEIAARLLSADRQQTAPRVSRNAQLIVDRAAGLIELGPYHYESNGNEVVHRWTRRGERWRWLRRVGPQGEPGSWQLLLGDIVELELSGVAAEEATVVSRYRAIRLISVTSRGAWLRDAGVTPAATAAPSGTAAPPGTAARSTTARRAERVCWLLTDDQRAEHPELPARYWARVGLVLAAPDSSVVFCDPVPAPWRDGQPVVQLTSTTPELSLTVAPAAAAGPRLTVRLGVGP